MTIRLPAQPLTQAEVDAAYRSLMTVGGIYDFIAEVVRYQEGARCVDLRT